MVDRGSLGPSDSKKSYGLPKSAYKAAVLLVLADAHPFRDEFVTWRDGGSDMNDIESGRRERPALLMQDADVVVTVDKGQEADTGAHRAGFRWCKGTRPTWAALMESIR